MEGSEGEVGHMVAVGARFLCRLLVLTVFVFPVLTVTGFCYPDRFEYLHDYRQKYETLNYRVKRGDTIWDILKALGLMETDREFLNFCKRLSGIRPGDNLIFYVRKSTGELEKIERLNHSSDSILKRVGERLVFYEVEKPVVVVREVIAGEIEDNLYNSSIRQGISPSVVLDLSDIFASDIDFNTDLRRGDRFVVYLERYARSGKYLGKPKVLAARMVVRGKKYEAFYFESKKGHGSYYDTDGNSMERLFLKAPLQYRRISSYFTERRFHPILKIYRPHHGIDYAAPTGTPISALGDGVVEFVGWRGGFGRFIVIRHNKIYKTSYGHLSRFARGLRVGKRVKKGQVIGYVGASGLATGPHLDFRFYKNGKPINYLKTRWPHAHSIPKSMLAVYREICQRYVSMLDNGEKRFFAKSASKRCSQASSSSTAQKAL